MGWRGCMSENWQPPAISFGEEKEFTQSTQRKSAQGAETRMKRGKLGTSGRKNQAIACLRRAGKHREWWGTLKFISWAVKREDRPFGVDRDREEGGCHELGWPAIRGSG
jgi:hypothetical protein